MLVVSIILEAAVAVIAGLAAGARRRYLYGLSFTFAAIIWLRLSARAKQAQKDAGDVPIEFFSNVLRRESPKSFPRDDCR